MSAIQGRVEDAKIQLRNFMPFLSQDKVILTIGKWVDSAYLCESIPIDRKDAETISRVFNVTIRDYE